MTPKLVWPEVTNVSQDAERDFVKVYEETDETCELV
jgi:hypothetical protein